VLPQRLQEKGFQYDSPDLTSALAAATTPAPR
jgi:NAD dependent epimerase/dehydratase family enzyme